MSRAVTIRVITLAAIIAVWWLPFTRAVHLFRYASDAYAETSSINDWNDYAFSRSLLISYSFSFLVSAAMGWLLFSMRVWSLMWPLGLSAFIALAVTFMKPESVIVLFQAMNPLLPAMFSAVVVAIAACIILTSRIPSKLGQNQPEAEDLFRRDV